MGRGMGRDATANRHTRQRTGTMTRLTVTPSGVRVCCAALLSHDKSHPQGCHTHTTHLHTLSRSHVAHKHRTLLFLSGHNPARTPLSLRTHDCLLVFMPQKAALIRRFASVPPRPLACIDGHRSITQSQQVRIAVAVRSIGWLPQVCLYLWVADPSKQTKVGMF